MTSVSYFEPFDNAKILGQELSSGFLIAVIAVPAGAIPGAPLHGGYLPG